MGEQQEVGGNGGIPPAVSEIFLAQDEGGDTHQRSSLDSQNEPELATTFHYYFSCSCSYYYYFHSSHIRYYYFIVIFVLHFPIVCCHQFLVFWGFPALIRLTFTRCPVEAPPPSHELFERRTLSATSPTPPMPHQALPSTREWAGCCGPHLLPSGVFWCQA